MWVGVESGVNYNYTHTSRHTTHSISPCEQQEKEAHKGKQPGPNCCCWGTKGREKQQAKKAREMRAGGRCFLSPVSPSHSLHRSFGNSGLLYPQRPGSSGGRAGAVSGKQTAAVHDAASPHCCCCCVVSHKLIFFP